MTRKEFLNAWPDFKGGLREMDLDALLQAREKQALERAAKVVCWYCLHGVPMANAHYHAAASMGEVNPCSASAIHALIAGLAETREVEGA